MAHYKPGDILYIYDRGYRCVRVLRSMGDYYIIRRLDRDCAFGCSGYRLYTEEEYQQLMAEEASPKISFLPPPLH